MRPGGAASAYGPGYAWSLRSSTPSVGCSGSVGGVSNAGDVKSKNSSMLSASASRFVSGDSANLVSMNFKIDENSRFLCETKFGFTQGEITINGTRNPL